MRKSYIEIIVGFLVAVSVLLVLASGYLSYKSLSSIVASIHSESVRDQKLNLIKSIATNLDKGEQGFRMYTYSKDEEDLKPYKNFLETIDADLEALRQAGKDNPQFLLNIDTISNLIYNKINVWNEILILNNTNIASHYLDTISKQLESKFENDSLRKNRSVFKKIFQRKKKVDLDEEKMITDIQQMKAKKEEHSSQIREKEQKLATSSSQITERLYGLIKKMEDEEVQKLNMKASEADVLANKTYRWIGWIAFSGTISALLVIFVLSRYLRRARAYQRALVASKKEAEMLAQTKERFIANVSHELRTPMGIISGFVEQLLKKPVEKSVERTLRIIKSSSDHLVRIIGDILDFSKLQSGKMKLDATHFRIEDIIEEVQMLFGSKAEESNILLEVSMGENLPPVLFGDQIRLKQILINLIGNAIKFTHQGKVKAGLNAVNLREESFDMKLIVEDTGIGIDSKDLDQIFQDFNQAERSTSRKYGGTGLGLSIVKHLIDLHNGTIEVSSEKGKGTIFTCTIPYRVGDETKIEKFLTDHTDLPESIKHLNVLCVDDEPYNRELMSAILTKWGLPHAVAVDGHDAIEKIGTGEFDVVLMDVRMPGMDGFQATKYIRESLHLEPEQLAVILSTATLLSDEDKKKFNSQGFNGYIPKPFTEEQLYRTLKSVIKADKKIRNNKSDTLVKDQTVKPDRINLTELYRFADRDENFAKEMLEKFIESFETGLKNMQSSFGDENRKQIGDAAHKMASPCRHIGANILLDGLKRIESMTADDYTSFDKIRVSISAVEKEFAEVKRQIGDHLTKIKKKES